MTWWQTLIQLAVAGGAGSLLTTAVTSFSQRRKVSAEASKAGADAASILTDTALKAATTSIENLEQQAEKLTKQLERTTEELQAVRRHMGVLEGLLRQQGVPVPELVWPPPRNGIA